MTTVAEAVFSINVYCLSTRKKGIYIHTFYQCMRFCKSNNKNQETIITCDNDIRNNKRHGESIVSIGVWLSDKLFFKCFLILNYYS